MHVGLECVAGECSLAPTSQTHDPQVPAIMVSQSYRAYALAETAELGPEVKRNAGQRDDDTRADQG